MATIERVTRKPKGGREQVSYRVRYRDPEHHQKSRTFKRKAEATRFATWVEHTIATGAYVDPRKGKITVAEYAPIWLRTKGKLRASSRARLEGVVRTHIIPAFGHRRLDQVSHEEVSEWVSDLQARRSEATARKALIALRQLYREAISARRIPFDPTEKVELPVEHAEKQRFLTAAEVSTLADAIEPRFRALVFLAAYGGLRYGELAGLRRKRIDLLRGRVEVAEAMIDVHGSAISYGPPKSERSLRTVPLPRRVVQELEHHLAEYVAPDADSLVFTGPKGAPIRRTGFRRLWWAPATRAAGLEGLKVHELRHTFVALSVAAGCDARKVSIWAGHSTVAFTLDRYGGLYRDDEAADMSRLDALLDTARPLEIAQVTSMKGQFR